MVNVQTPDEYASDNLELSHPLVPVPQAGGARPLALQPMSSLRGSEKRPNTTSANTAAPSPRRQVMSLVDRHAMAASLHETAPRSLLDSTTERLASRGSKAVQFKPSTMRGIKDLPLSTQARKFAFGSSDSVKVQFGVVPSKLVVEEDPATPNQAQRKGMPKDNERLAELMDLASMQAQILSFQC
jgi:hypothetical protein